MPFLVFYKATMGTYLFALGDFSGSDLLELHLPFKYILHDAYTHGHIPLWTPYLSNGFPILAEGQSGVLYPLHILLAFLSPTLGLNYSILFAFSIAGVGAYLYALRMPKMNRFGAFSVAVVFMFCSFFVARLKHINMIVVAAYLPWSLYCIKRAIELNIKFIWFVALGVIWGLQLLAGHPHMFFLCALICVWYTTGELVRIYYLSGKKFVNNYLSLVIGALCGLFVSSIIAVGLSAAQLIPTYELTQLSTRLSFNYETATDYPLRPQFLASLFAPFFLGNPANGAYPNTKQTIHEVGIWWENVLYIGLLPFVLVVLMFFLRAKALVAKFFVKKKAYVYDEFSYYYWFYFVSIVLFFLLSTGSYTPLFSFVYNTVPGMQLFRFPTRFNLLSLFALSLMSGWTLVRVVARLEKSRVESNLKKEESTDYVFSWPFKSGITYILFILLFVLDLGVFSYQYVSFYHIQSYLSPTDTLKKFHDDSSLYRIYPTTQYSQNPYGAMGWMRGEKAIYALQQAIPGNFSAIYQLYSFTDRGWFEGGFGVKERMMLEKAITSTEIPAEYLSKILGLWNVKYVIGFSELESDYFSSVSKYKLGDPFGVPLNVFENKKVMPRAYIASRINRASDMNDEMKQLFNTKFSPYFAATSVKEGEESSGSADFDLVKFKDNNTVSIVDYQNEKVVMKSVSANDGVLAFSDTFYPGWKAYVDGIERPILEVNLVQRAIKLEKGEHTIVWLYEPYGFFVGLCISFATLITVTVVAFVYRKKGSREWARVFWSKI